jgi:outer membrane protein TolC
VRERVIAVLLALGFLSGCKLGPNYHKPLVPIPDVYHGAGESQNVQAKAGSFADLPWWEVFQDPVLQDLIRKTLEHNYNLQLATERITAARAQLTITRSAEFPQITASGVGINENAFNGGFPVRTKYGVATRLDVLQAQQVLDTANTEIPELERQIGQLEDAISILLGDYPHPIERGRPLVQQPIPPEVPAGLPSSLLARRPDISQAEQNLIAANAEIGVAKAAFFPDISLTGSVGGANGSTSVFSTVNAELTLAQDRGNEYQSLVQLYKALGGGWQP